MPTNIRGQVHLEAKKNTLSFGPWDFFTNAVFPELFAAQIQINPLTFAQIIGGVSPAITSISTMYYLSIFPDQTIQVGLHGVNAQSQGFTLNGNGHFDMGPCNLTQLSLYNTTAVVVNIVLLIGGV